MTTETMPATVPLEPTTPIKPSEALRLGRLLYPESSTGSWFHGARAACALGSIHAGWTGGNDMTASSYDEGTHDRLVRMGILQPIVDIGCLYDDAVRDGRDGDAVVLEYLESRGL